MPLCDILLNTLPRYETKIPSTKEEVWFRPLLVKEERLLLQISEFGTYKEKINCIIRILESCFEYENIKKLTIVDIQYLFIKLRIKSIGSNVSPYFICQETGEKIKLKIDLNDIEVAYDPRHVSLLEFSNIKIKMKYPDINTILEYDTTKSNDDDVYNLAISCIDEIHTHDEKIQGSDQNKNEMEAFLDSMTKDQFDKIVLFFETMPKIEKSVEYTTADGIVRTVVLRGISDFFV